MQVLIQLLVFVAVCTSWVAVALQFSQPTPTKHDLYTNRDPRRVKILDTTLRDGEQAPGCALTQPDKLRVANQLAVLGVDILEAGFPVTSKGEFEAVSSIASSVGARYDSPPIICAAGRAVLKDVKVCCDAVQGAMFPRVNVIVSTSDIHMLHKLKKTREQVLALTKDAVEYAMTMVSDVQVTAEDATRSDVDFLVEVCKVAVTAGARTLNIADTVGYHTPNEFQSLVTSVRNNFGADVCVSAHGHNDLGMCVANFMAAVEGGARQLECTINGIGERAGNAALEEVVMALHVRREIMMQRMGLELQDYPHPLTYINTRELCRVSRLVSDLTGMIVPPNKAIVGSNIFSHGSGIHQDGVLKNRLTYEILDEETVGAIPQSLVLCKYSGRHGFKVRLQEMGHCLGEDDFIRAFATFKEVADKKKEVTDKDLAAIVSSLGLHKSNGLFA